MGDEVSSLVSSLQLQRRGNMRVCMLAYTFYESDMRIQHYVSALADRGDEVDVIALKRSGYSDHETVGNVKVYRIQSRKVDERGPLSYLFKIVRFLFLSAFVLRRKHLARPYQVIHVHSVPDFLVFAAFFPKLSGARIILDIHDILPEFYASKFKVTDRSPVFRLLKLVEKWSIAFAHHVIIANHLWWERLVSRSVRREKCTPLCNYPDPRYFFPHAKKRADGKFIMMYPGTLNWHQGVDIAIKAFAKIKDRIPEAEFQIYGEGSETPRLKRLAAELGMNGRVRFSGLLPSDQIANEMATADLAVVPKRASSPFGNEAASTKIMEFMALGVPVVASRTKIDAYYFGDSMVKFFEPENETDLADAILSLKADPELRNRLVSNSLNYVKLNNWEEKKFEYLRLVDFLTKPQEGEKRSPEMQ